ncbi:MAG TPA: DUF72 domain-containing protein [Thermoplasmata archaeon]|nr:DUF72 domain-containing protein [Thermoplasmata archaeon]
MSEYRIGCSSWTSPAWSGRFYPPGLADGDRLAFYARYFDAVEVDSSYYGAPNPYVVRGWARKTPESFRFTLKMTRDLLDPKSEPKPEQLQRFVDSAQRLGPKLGAILLQFPPWFRPGRSWEAGTGAMLERLVRNLPSGPRYSVELRDAGWYSESMRPQLVRLLGDRQIASCWSSLTYVDIPPLRTAPWAYLRFIGDHETVPAEVHGEIRVDRTKETRQWAEHLRASEMESAFAFFNNHFAGYAPSSANLFRAELGLPEVRLPVSSRLPE